MGQPSKQHDITHSCQVDITGATPMIRQFLDVKKNYTGTILFYRMGDFYETFFEDAIICARVLDITLTGRDAGKLGRIPMAGIPVKSVESYLTRLLNKNFKVAVCEQTEDAALAKGLVERKVVRVLSSGTITEQSLLKAEENNFLAALVLGSKPGEPCGLAFCDITTGAFYATELSFEQLLSELDRIRPTEILVKGRKKKALPGQGVDETVPDVPQSITDAYNCTPLAQQAFRLDESEPVLKTLFQVNSLEGFSLNDTRQALQAAGVVGYYLKENFLASLPRFDRIQVYSLNRTVTMNATTRKNLELVNTVKNHQYEGSLLWTLNKTSTNMGARLFRQWIHQPLKDLNEIQSRLDGVDELVKAPEIRETLGHLLPEIYDIERLSTKVANVTALPRDLLALKLSISRLPELSTALKPLTSFYMSRMHAFPPELFKLVALIDRSLSDSPPMNLKEGGIIREGYNQELDRLRHILEGHEAWLTQYEQEQRERTDIKNLKVSYNSAFGYFIEVSRANASRVPDDYRRKQTLTNSERYTTPELKTHEAQLLEAQSQRFDLEYQLFVELREKLTIYADALKDCAHRVAVLDVLHSFSTVAVEQNYVKPLVDDSLELNIQNGRHPVIEKMLPMGQFVPNHCVLSSQEKEYALPQVMLITGPNMAGKSTYMRQVALIVLMAQIGSFVPASYARIGYVDSIYTRVGAVDDLSSGQSTFMVEMNETAQVLNGATRRSLVLLDEIGRGTSTYDGISIASSVTEYLVRKTGCRTLFATHYHELNTLEKTHPKVQNYRVCVSEHEYAAESGQIEFLHTVEPGAAQKSYGIQVAKMAGLPHDVITRAEGLLADMQKKELASLTSSSRIHARKSQESPQLTLF